jgi:SAM-dependent methyltransferase
VADTERQLAAQAPWDWVARGYAAESDFLMVIFSRRAIELVAPTSTARVVDVAAGPGTLTLELAPRVAHVDAVDFSQAMLAELETAAAARNITNVRAVLADGQALPFADASYDAGFSMFGLMFFPDRSKGYSELFRVLKPGGVVAISSWAPVEECPLIQVMFEGLTALEPTTQLPRADVAGLENPDVLAAELRAAGFMDVTIHSHSHSVELPRSMARGAEERPRGGTSSMDVRTLWDRMTRGGVPFVALRRKLGEEEWQRREPRALAAFESFISRSKGPLSTKAWIAVGRKPA